MQTPVLETKTSLHCFVSAYESILLKLGLP
jgi:hypothetical protein